MLGSAPRFGAGDLYYPHDPAMATPEVCRRHELRQRIVTPSDSARSGWCCRLCRGGHLLDLWRTAVRAHPQAAGVRLFVTQVEASWRSGQGDGGPVTIRIYGAAAVLLLSAASTSAESTAGLPNCAGADIAEADLSFTNLVGANLTGANLAGANR